MTTLTPLINATGKGHAKRETNPAYPLRYSVPDELNSDSANESQLGWCMAQLDRTIRKIRERGNVSNFAVIRNFGGFMDWHDEVPDVPIADVMRATYLPRLVKWLADEHKMATWLYSTYMGKMNLGTFRDPWVVDTSVEADLLLADVFRFAESMYIRVGCTLKETGASKFIFDWPGRANPRFGKWVCSKLFAHTIGFENIPARDQWWYGRGSAYVTLTGSDSEANTKKRPLESDVRRRADDNGVDYGHVHLWANGNDDPIDELADWPASWWIPTHHAEVR